MRLNVSRTGILFNAKNQNGNPIQVLRSPYHGQGSDNTMGNEQSKVHSISLQETKGDAPASVSKIAFITSGHI
jgi:hypothetical protein